MDDPVIGRRSTLLSCKYYVSGLGNVKSTVHREREKRIIHNLLSNARAVIPDDYYGR